MLTVFSIKHKLKDRGIHWEEHYHEKSAHVKNKFDKILPGSYFRWEGFDHESGRNYYIVVGPALSKRHGKSFFAGVKKMPKDPHQKAYSPSGKYFSSLSSALHHATDTWGVTYPQNAGSYKKSDLMHIEIPRHVKG